MNSSDFQELYNVITDYQLYNKNPVDLGGWCGNFTILYSAIKDGILEGTDFDCGSKEIKNKLIRLLDNAIERKTTEFGDKSINAVITNTDPDITWKKPKNKRGMDDGNKYTSGLEDTLTNLGINSEPTILRLVNNSKGNQHYVYGVGVDKQAVQSGKLTQGNILYIDTDDGKIKTNPQKKTNADSYIWQLYSTYVCNFT